MLPNVPMDAPPPPPLPILPLTIFVPGMPKTKGSMQFFGPGQVKQSVVGSTQWAILMAARFRQAWGDRPPLDGPLFCWSTFVLPDDPIAPRAGDGDKLERNVWDALQPCQREGRGACAVGCKKHAGLIVDDVQIVHWIGTKRKTYGPQDPPGVSVMIGRYR